VEGGRTVEAQKGRKRDEKRVLLFGSSRRGRASERATCTLGAPSEKLGPLARSRGGSLASSRPRGERRASSRDFSIFSVYLLTFFRRVSAPCNHHRRTAGILSAVL